MRKSMNNVTTWFELPVSDIEQAKAFYASVLQTKMIDEAMEGYRMAIFDHDEHAVSGMLISSEGYIPSATGSIIYFNGGDDLAIPLARAVENGAKVIILKTAIADGAKGYFAQFKDSEGNRVGLYSLPMNA